MRAERAIVPWKPVMSQRALVVVHPKPTQLANKGETPDASKRASQREITEVD